MIVCSRCGFHNEDSDTFCGSCASFLEWEGQKVAAEAPTPAPQPEPEPEPEADAHVGIIDRVKEVIGIGDSPATGTAAGAAEPAGAPAEEVAPAPVEPEPPTPGAVAAPVSGGGLSGRVGGPASAGVPAPPATGSEATVAPSDVVPTAPTPAPPAAPAAPTPAPAPVMAAPPAVPATAPAPAPAVPAAATPAPATPGPGLSAPGAPKRTTVSETPAPAQSSTPLQPGGAVQPGTAAAAGAVAAAGAGQPGPVAPTAVQPQAVKPQATKARPVAKKAPSTRQMNPGDKVCGQCGEGNDPSRKFCRRCGGSLVEAAVFQLPWYKALWRKLFTKKQRQAGDRPKMRRRAIGGHGGWLTRAIGTIIVLAIIAVVVLSFVGPWHKSLHTREVRYYHDVVGQVHPTYNQFFAHAATATSSAAGHPPINAIDGELNTSWQSAGTVTGQSLTVQFAQATNVAKIGLHIGDQDTPQSYETEPRPEKIQLVFQGAKTVTKTLTVKDSATFQTFSVSADGATSVTFKIESVYAATGSGQNLSIAEIEFFTKS